MVQCACASIIKFQSSFFKLFIKHLMHQSILALPIPPPGHLHLFVARGPGIGTCKVVPGAGNCLPAGHLTRPDVSATNTCYYIKMASKNSRVKTRILSIFSFTKRRTCQRNKLKLCLTLEFIVQSLFILVRYCILTIEPTSTFFMFKRWDDCCNFYTRKLILLWKF